MKKGEVNSPLLHLETLQNSQEGAAQDVAAKRALQATKAHRKPDEGKLYVTRAIAYEAHRSHEGLNTVFNGGKKCSGSALGAFCVCTNCSQSTKGRGMLDQLVKNCLGATSAPLDGKSDCEEKVSDNGGCKYIVSQE